MATYKIPQDVEAEDTLIGPFTVKQSIFLLVAAFFGGLAFFAARITPLMLIILGPPFLIFFFLGVYRPKDQPIEVYLAARFRFLFKQRKRVWDASGIHSEHVTIDEHAKVEDPRRNIVGNTQVNNRLDRLSMLMDSRGWSTRGAQEVAPGTVAPGFQKSDRLANASHHHLEAETYAEDDILDPLSNQAANTIMQLNRASQVERRREIISQMRDPQYQDMVAAQQNNYQTASVNGQQNAVNQAPNPAIMNLLDNNDLTVSGIAKQANTKR